MGEWKGLQIQAARIDSLLSDIIFDKLSQAISGVIGETVIDTMKPECLAVIDLGFYFLSFALNRVYFP